ncbi:Hsp70 family protein [Steroidobacter sp.]|uniref:Hsp70 family protein n=1 Tax=Steroidobacter sp. TaxID=1978227 RepID=UPI001A594ED4|nr:Hsp70 family protein [Steroidobacter sp.]MBL8270983.1 Hsp70 family protein [Steroidobacter sp.]
MPTLFPDFHDANEFRTSSVVHVGPQGCLVGSVLEELLQEDPSLAVARFAKLNLGQSDPVYTDHLGRSWTAEGISAIILRKMLRDVGAFASESIGSVTVTVPASFNDAQRKGTKAAVALAGLPSATLAEEPVAAAVYYGLSESVRDQTLLVYDFGGGTFDATLLQASPKGVFAIATDGVAVGGKDIDERLMRQVAVEFQRQHGFSPLEDPVSRATLWRFANETKIQLSKPGRGLVRKTLLLSGRTLDFTITRSQFDKLIEPLVEQTLQVCERTLLGAGLSWSMVDKVLQVGGSSLLPIAHDALRRRSGKAAEELICKQPHQAVAYGAALLAGAGRLDSDGEGPEVRQIAAFDLGIRVADKATGRPTVQVLIPRNAPLPASNVATFYTTRPDQTRLVIEVVQCKSEGQESSLGRFAFGPIRKPRKNYPIEIQLRYDSEGMAVVVARDPSTNEVMERQLGAEDDVASNALREQRGWLAGLRINE